MGRLALLLAGFVLGTPAVSQAQTVYTNPVCEYKVTFPHGSLTKEDEFTARTSFEATPYLSAKCFRCPHACRFRTGLKKRMLTELLAQFELKDYVVKDEPDPHMGFLISGITTKENSVTRIEARVVFGKNSILVLSTVEPAASDRSTATAFLHSARHR